MAHAPQGHLVVVTSWACEGKRGKILRVISSRVVVEKVAMIAAFGRRRLGCLDGNRRRGAERCGPLLGDGLATFVRGHRRVLLRDRVARAQQAQCKTQSRQSTHDTNALRLMASSSHLMSPRELGHEQ